MDVNLFTLFLLLSLFHWSTAVIVAEVEDIIIEYEDEIIYCDGMICPEESLACRVTKENDPTDYTKIMRRRKCFSANGDILRFETRTEDNPYTANLTLSVFTGGGSEQFLRRLARKEMESYRMAVWSAMPGLISRLEDAEEIKAMSTTLRSWAKYLQENESERRNLREEIE